MPGTYASTASRTVAGLRLVSELQPRRMSFAHLLPGAEYAALLLSGGEAAVAVADNRFELTGPAIAWLHLQPGASLSLAPGSPGHLLGLAEQAVVEATADGTDAPLLRSLAGKSFTIEAPASAELRELVVALEGVLRETHTAERGSRTLLAAYVRIILVALWRLSGVEQAGEGTVGQTRAVLIRFRELVEIHFRDRWRVRDYAAAIGVSHDRLHDLCTRELHRTPIDLLHDRLNFEARRHLTRAALSVSQVSHALGFRDPAHFSTFFKKLNGVSPTAFRQTVRQSDRAAGAAASPGYADWP